MKTEDQLNLIETIIREAPNGATKKEIEGVVESQYPGQLKKCWWNHLTTLYRAGRVVRVGKDPSRGQGSVYRIAPPGTVPPGEPEDPGVTQALQRGLGAKAEVILDLYLGATPAVRREVRALMAEEREEQKAAAQADAMLRTAERLLATDQKHQVKAEERRQLERRQLAEHLLRGGQYWSALVERVEEFTTLVGTYVAEFKDLPPPDEVHYAVLDRALEDMEKTLAWLNDRLYRKRLTGGDVINVEA
jgi:hypothetical protein